MVRAPSNAFLQFKPKDEGKRLNAQASTNLNYERERSKHASVQPFYIQRSNTVIMGQHSKVFCEFADILLHAKADTGEERKALSQD